MCRSLFFVVVCRLMFVAVCCFLLMGGVVCCLTFGLKHIRRELLFVVYWFVVCRLSLCCYVLFDVYCRVWLVVDCVLSVCC